MKKHLLTVLLIACLLLAVLPTTVLAAGSDRGVNLSGLEIGAPENASEATLTAGVNILKAGAENTVYDIDAGKAVMISGQDTPVHFENCTFNLTGKTIKISGNQDGIIYHNGEVATKLWIGGKVTFENCAFITDSTGSKSTSAGYDACIYFFSGDISLNDCTLTANGYNGQFLGLYGSPGAVTFENSQISTADNKNGWSYAMYGGSVLKLQQSTMTVTGASTTSGNTNAFYSGDNRTGYDAIFFEDSIVRFTDNKAGGFAINNVNIHVDNSEVTVSNNAGNACNSGYWIVSDSDFTMNGNRGGHALSCIGFEMTDTNVEILHNGYAGIYIQSEASSFENCSVDLRCNGEKLLSYSAGDLWLNGRTLTVTDCTSQAQPGSAWLGGVGRKGEVSTPSGTVVAYDLNTNAADNLKSNTAPVLAEANLALNEESDAHTLFLNPFMKTPYARGNGEDNSSNNDADLFEDDRVVNGTNTREDIIGGDAAKIGTLTTAQLSHHLYDWDNGEVTDDATPENYGVLRYTCTTCSEYMDHTDAHANSFDCQGTYVYAPLVGVTFEPNAEDDTVTGMPADDTDIPYGGTVTLPEKEPVRRGWKFTGWYLDADCTIPFDEDTALTDNWTVLYAGWEWSPILPILPGLEFPDADLPGLLNLEDHYAYIIGYDDGNVKPNANITRAEVATIFFRLLTDDARAYYWSTDSGFSDVHEGDWYNNAVSTMVQAGILNGYSDGTFRPNANITRGEFATIAARFLSNPYSTKDRFYDTEGHWAEVYINRAAEAGWIDGYPDGTFRPDQAITRAEAVTLVNAVLGRAPHEDHLLPDMIVWPDNPKSAWYYEAIQEATNSHDYDWAASHAYEIWTELLENRQWSKLEKEWSDAYSAPGGDVMD